MSWLGLGVVVVGAVCLLNLILMYGVIRRLRAHSEVLATVQQVFPNGAPPPEDFLPPLNSVVEPFRATTVDGVSLDASQVGPRALVGFFSPDCAPCEVLLPRFVAAIERERLSADEVLAVIADGGDQEKYLTELGSIATVVRDDDGAVTRAFGVRVYPTVCRVDDTGSVTALDRTLRSLAPAPARA